jgi:very-short-patch-repair endonuclease
VYKAEKPIPRADEDEWQRQSDTLQQTRKQLNQYVRELHRPRFALQRSAFYAYGRLARLHEILDRAFSIPAVEAVTPTDLERTVQAVDGLREFADIFDQYDTYPWRETLATAHTLELESTIRDRFGSLSHALKALDAGLAEIRGALGEHDEHLTFGWAKHALERLALALSSPLPPRRWLKRNEPERIRVLASEAAARSEAYWRERKQFDAKYVRSALELDHAALLQVMTEGATHALACIQDRGRPPQNTISVQRKEIDQLQRHACATLEELLPAARTLAEVCHAAIPTTIREVDALGQLADSVLAAPNPPSGWLDSGKFGMMRAVVVDAGKRYEECAHLQMPLEATYQPGYFEQDLRTYAERFQKKYQWPLRYFRLGYYRDLRRLRSVLQPGQERTAAQVEADLSQAVKLADAQAWLSEHRVKHAQALEHYFDGERTDWKQVRAALKWTGGFHAHVRLASAAPEIVQLVTGPAKALSVVRARTEQLRRLWVDWSQLASTLVESIKISSLLPGGLALEDADISELRMALQGLHAELTAIWTASDTIKSHRLPGSSDQSSAPMSNGLSGLCEDVRMAGAVRAFEVWIEEHSQVFSAEFEHFFGGLHTDWPALLATLDWTMRFLRLYPNGKVHDELARLVSSEGDAPQRERLRQVLQQAHANLAGVEKGLAFSDEVLPRSALLPPGLAQDDATIEAVGARIDSLLEKLSCLKRWLDCSQRLQQFREIGLGAFIDAMLGMHPFPQTVAQIFERRFYTLWLDRVWRESPILKQFHGETQERTIQRFRKLDVEHAKLARQRLHTLLAQQRGAAVSFARLSVDDDVSEAVIALKREVNLKRHRSIRHIVRRVAPALIELKPCWMMSPLSVSQFVETGAQLFDLVIFDEASQVCAEDAICAILRGKQLIVVGDSKQLPPTRFFTKTLADEDDEDDDKESGEERAERERVESILDECQGSGFLSRSLRWHYRSRHESLIAFSNHHFYHDDLITFPSPDARHEDGIRFVHVKDGVYDRSRSRTNRREAERVVDLVTASLREQPDLSVGVVALSEAQQRAIRDVIEGRLRSSPDLQAWQQELLEENPAGFFVKNLESVQGDERDVIILSIGYGPDASGNIYQNFGPVNRKGGERRLNVAVTRARHQLIVVASMHATDLPSELASPGARTLRAYLEYAEHGPSVLRDQSLAASSQAGARSEPEFESPFEQDVYDALVARGLNLDTQVGCSDYRIDLAVRDPQRPGKYLLGIECDGRAYHSSHTARDRDRLRQRHLEKMGWRIHRIWSSDWWNNRDGEVVRVLNALNALRGPT